MIAVSNSVMCVVLAAYTVASGELVAACAYCAAHKDVAGVLLAQGLSAYLGLRCYLSIVRERGGVAAVLLANARKVATIVLSFVLFAKPFNERHFVGLVLVFAGVGMGYASKRGGGKEASEGGRRDSSPGKKRERRANGCDERHGHIA
ncbi:hypothetical protein ACHAWF_006771 [Thalassiosira exigua]